MEVSREEGPDGGGGVPGGDGGGPAGRGANVLGGAQARSGALGRPPLLAHADALRGEPGLHPPDGARGREPARERDPGVGTRTGAIVFPYPLRGGALPRIRTVSLAGMAWTLLPNGKGGGLFLQPKLVGLPSWVGGNQWKAAGAQLSLGLDVGYRLNLGRLFLAFVVGGSAGRGWNVPRNTSSLYTSFLDIPTSYRTNKWVWDVNLNLVRIGANF